MMHPRSALMQTRPGKMAIKLARYGKSRLLGADIPVIHDGLAQFAYVPIPKNACSTVKRALIGLIEPDDHARITAPGARFDIHDYCWHRLDFWMTRSQLAGLAGFRFTIIRDPIDRLISAHANRVFDKHDLELPGTNRRLLQRRGLPLRPDLDTFALNLAFYSRANVSIAHHTRPQATILKDVSLFDEIYRTDELSRLAGDLKARCGIDVDFGHANRSEMRKGQLSPTALAAARDFYRRDYEMLAQYLPSGLSDHDADTDMKRVARA